MSGARVWIVLSAAAASVADRLISIPDIHGDFDIMKEALSLVEPFTSTDQLVFTGDLVDRGPQPRECYEHSEQLARQYNVTRLIGNHEWVTLMGVDKNNLFAQFVPKEDLQSFGGWSGRMAAFSAEGDLGKLIRQGFDVMALRQLPGDPRSRTLFVHAGITSETMRTYGSAEAIQAAGKSMLLDDRLSTDLLDEILQDRHLAQGRDSEVCEEVDDILKVARAERLVLGHTPTLMLRAPRGNPLVKCGGRLLLSDVAMNRWMGGGMPSVLVLEDDLTTGLLSRIYFKHNRGQVTEVPVLDHLNDYSTKDEL